MIILILLIFFISIKINFIFNSWISFILFLAIIGGLIIIYIYITRLTRNEIFYLNWKIIILNIIKIFPIILILWIINIYLPINFLIKLNISDSWNINNYIFIFNQFNLNILLNEINNNSTYFIIIYIYYSIICIINICYKLKTPLRQLIF